MLCKRFSLYFLKPCLSHENKFKLACLRMRPCGVEPTQPFAPAQSLTSMDERAQPRGAEPLIADIWVSLATPSLYQQKHQPNRQSWRIINKNSKVRWKFSGGLLLELAQHLVSPNLTGNREDQSPLGQIYSGWTDLDTKKFSPSLVKIWMSFRGLLVCFIKAIFTLQNDSPDKFFK